MRVCEWYLSTACQCVAGENRPAYVPRCGDMVLHRPSGERWLVAYCDGERLSWFGWPDGWAPLSECDLIAQCTDEEHAARCADWEGRTCHRGRKVAALYSKPATAHGEELGK